MLGSRVVCVVWIESCLCCLNRGLSLLFGSRVVSVVWIKGCLCCLDRGLSVLFAPRAVCVVCIEGCLCCLEMAQLDCLWRLKWYYPLLGVALFGRLYRLEGVQLVSLGFGVALIGCRCLRRFQMTLVLFVLCWGGTVWLFVWFTAVTICMSVWFTAVTVCLCGLQRSLFFCVVYSCHCLDVCVVYSGHCFSVWFTAVTVWLSLFVSRGDTLWLSLSFSIDLHIQAILVFVV